MLFLFTFTIRNFSIFPICYSRSHETRAHFYDEWRVTLIRDLFFFFFPLFFLWIKLLITTQYETILYYSLIYSLFNIRPPLAESFNTKINICSVISTIKIVWIQIHVGFLHYYLAIDPVDNYIPLEFHRFIKWIVLYLAVDSNIDIIL